MSEGQSFDREARGANAPNFFIAQKFFHACEKGEGWEVCGPFCNEDAVFSGNFNGPLASTKTAKDYTAFMQGIHKAMPGNTYETKFQSYDDARKTACFVGIFRGTHSEDCEGFPPKTGKSTVSDYVYTLTFDDAGKIKAMSKIWNDAFAMEEFGWVPAVAEASNFVMAQKFFHACEKGEGWEVCGPLCNEDAVFSGNFCGPLVSTKTAKDYTAFMQGIHKAMPGNTYETKFQSYDEARKTACFVGIFRGTHSEDCEGFPPKTGKSTVSDYVYTLTFDDAGKIKAMSKIWNDAFAMKEFGWA